MKVCVSWMTLGTADITLATNQVIPGSFLSIQDYIF